MLPYLALAATSFAGLWYYAVHKGVKSKLFSGTWTSQQSCDSYDTLVDMRSIVRVRELVSAVVTDGDDTDAMATRLERLLRHFPPDEFVMRRLSLMQQKVSGRSDADEFCVTLVFSVAMLCCATSAKHVASSKKPVSLLRSQSV